MSQRAAGFTLLEMVLALAVFAVLGLMGNRLLQQGIALERFSARHAQRLAQIQHAFALMERDFSAMIPRPVRTPGVMAGSSPRTSEGRHGDDAVVFTHGGWLNPGDRLARSSLQRVAYRLAEGALVREYLTYPDMPTDNRLHRQRLLSGVKALQLRYWHQGRWQRQWQEIEGLPQAVEIRLELTEDKTLIRRFLLKE
jgi:general secretion pathway protein J